MARATPRDVQILRQLASATKAAGLGDVAADGILRKVARPDTGKLAMTDTPKDSPLINQTREGSRPASTRMDVEPPSNLPDTRHSHLHQHSDDTGNYQHEHPHDHAVRHSPSADMDSDQHDHHSPANKAARLRRVATMAADHPDPLVRQGGRELSKLADAAERKLVTKARVTPTEVLPADVRKMIQDTVSSAVAKALGTYRR